MAKPLIISINSLTSVAVTRARGTKTFDALIESIKNTEHCASTVLIDISGMRVLSSSFLDELILRISNVHDSKLPKIGFHVASRAEVSKLEKACSLRNVKCIYRVAHESKVRTTRIIKNVPLEVTTYPGNFFAS